ncbi:MAG: hypothetical protein VZT48_12295 [Bulleidia sp.]|nr:hypothetical protein [Bulleidia sp.]
MSEKTQETLKVLAALLVSAVFCAICVNLCLYADLGSDSITVFEDGLHEAFHVSVGTASWIYNAGVILIALFTGRKHIGWTTFAFAIMEGFVIDIMDRWMAPVFNTGPSLLIRWIYVFLAIFCLGVSIALLVLYRNGMDGLDAICYGLAEKTKISYKWLRTAGDTTLLIAGYLLGGRVGLGSVPAVLLTGITADALVRFLSKAGLGLKKA